MTSFIRHAIVLALFGCAQWVPSVALADQWPAKPIRLIVPAPPGGVTDILARSVSQKLTSSLGQAVVPDYRPGGNMVIASEAAARAAPDGYTLLLGASNSHTFNPLLRANLPYDAVKDFEPIALLVTVPFLLASSTVLPVDSVKALVDYARANPGKLSYGSWGTGSSSNVAMELLKLRAGIDMVHVPYKGTAAAEADLLAGRLDVMITTFTALPHVKAGKMRGLATTSKRRASLAPDLPTIAESGYSDYEASGWYGVFAPARTPEQVIRTLNTELNKVLNTPDVQERLKNLALEPEGGTPERLRDLMRSEREKWGRVIREARIKVD